MKDDLKFIFIVLVIFMVLYFLGLGFIEDAKQVNELIKYLSK